MTALAFPEDPFERVQQIAALEEWLQGLGAELEEGVDETLGVAFEDRA